LAVNKPVGMTSHDVVDHFKKVFRPSKVGHAGTLDPFASGILIILVGKATKDSDMFLEKDKEYIADVLLGVSTTTGDPEGEVMGAKNTDGDWRLETDNYTTDVEKKLPSVLKSFMPSYDQYVPVFSSVKVDGQKLRVLARKYDHFEIEEVGSSKVVKFYDAKDVLKKEVNLPHKEVKIYEIELVSSNQFPVTRLSKLLPQIGDVKISAESEFIVAKVRVKCSKGTYIRQLAVDIGEKLGIPAMLVGLERTQIDIITLSQSHSVNEFTA
jgi:tRNA pseudouridine55 synthase